MSFIADGSLDGAMDANLSSSKDQPSPKVAPSTLQSVGRPAKRRASDRTTLDEARDANPSSSKDQPSPEVAPSTLQSVGRPAKRRASDRTTLEKVTSPPKRAKLDDMSLDIGRGLPVQAQGMEDRAKTREATASAEGDGDEVATVSQRRSRSLPSSQQGLRSPRFGRRTTHSSQPQGRSDQKTGQDLVPEATPQVIKDSPTASHVRKSHSSGPCVPWKLDLLQPCRKIHTFDSGVTDNSGPTPVRHQQNDTSTCSESRTTPPDSTKPEEETSASSPSKGGHSLPKESLTESRYTAPELAAIQPPPAQVVSGLKHTETSQCSQDTEKPDSSQQPPSRPPEPPGREVSPPPSLLFSSEEEEEEEEQDKMLSTQMNQRIDRVQVFLKMDRLKRPRHTKPINKPSTHN